MLSNRQTELLKIIVETYIKDVKPIGSKSICQKLRCSSATVRNDMGVLEDNGLIEKTHISSGRIPSEKGYRYYVDHIMKPKELNGEDMLKLQTIFKNNSLVLDDYITKSMEIISEMTNYTTIVLGKSSKDNHITKVEVIPISDQALVAVVITDKGHVEHKNIYIEERVSIEDVRQTVDIINKLIVGTPIDEVSSKLEFEVKPVIERYVKQHEVLYNAFYNAFNEFTESNVTVRGARNILMQPEFDDTSKMREILSKFEDKEMIQNIKEGDNGIKIYIGSENEFSEDVTVIKTKYSYNGEEGTIALIGPKRMEYDRVLTLLNYIKDHTDR